MTRGGEPLVEVLLCSCSTSHVSDVLDEDCGQRTSARQRESLSLGLQSSSKSKLLLSGSLGHLGANGERSGRTGGGDPSDIGLWSSLRTDDELTALNTEDFRQALYTICAMTALIRVPIHRQHPRTFLTTHY